MNEDTNLRAAPNPALNIAIVSGSALIAQFVGDDFFVKLGFTYPKPMFIEGRILPEHCKFEKSWDWLMPVLL